MEISGYSGLRKLGKFGVEKKYSYLFYLLRVKPSVTHLLQFFHKSLRGGCGGCGGSQ
jgi:hypothetical protein